MYNDYQRARYCDMGWPLNNYCHPFIYQSLLLLYVHGASLSLAAAVMCISVFPGFLMNFIMIHVQELLMTLTVG